MALKIALIDGYAFQSHDALQPINFENVVHHQEWRTVRQNFLDANAVKNHLIASMSARRSMVETAGATLSRWATGAPHPLSEGCKYSLPFGELQGQPTSLNYMRNTPPSKRGLP
jgi:hypothetical protein